MPRDLVFGRRNFSVFRLHLNSADQLVGTAVAEFEQDLTQGFLIVALGGVIALNLQRFVELVDGYITKLHQNLYQKGFVFGGRA